MQTTTRKEAKDSGLTVYYTGKPCRRGHLSERRTSNWACIECDNLMSRNFRKKNPELVKEYKRKWRHNNLSRCNENIKKWNRENKERRNEIRRKWDKENPTAVLAKTRKYQADKINATPKWADMNKIREIYREAGRLTRVTGREFHVDHIIPLRGENVCGLHVENNLRIVLASWNLKKGNRIDFAKQ